MEQFSFSIPKWNIEAETGYKPQTTFWQDFCIADKFCIEAIKDTFKRAFNEWKDNIEYLTELALVTNHKSWSWYPSKNGYWQFYAEAYQKCRDYVYSEESSFNEEERNYYYRITD